MAGLDRACFLQRRQRLWLSSTPKHMSRGEVITFRHLPAMTNTTGAWSNFRKRFWIFIYLFAALGRCPGPHANVTPFRMVASH